MTIHNIPTLEILINSYSVSKDMYNCTFYFPCGNEMAVFVGREEMDQYSENVLNSDDFTPYLDKESNYKYSD